MVARSSRLPLWLLARAPPNSQFPRINGGATHQRYLYDGISVLQPEPGQVAYLPVVDRYRVQDREQ